MYNLRSGVEKSYVGLPMLLKHTCVDLIQYFERFSRFNLYTNIDHAGLVESIKWKQLVLLYLDQSHSFIDHQRKIYNHFSKEYGVNLDEDRKKVLDNLGVDSYLIKILRNEYHHANMDIVSIAVVMGGEKNYPCIPTLWMRSDSSNRDDVKCRIEELKSDPGIIPQVFINHCNDFINSSKEIKSLMEPIFDKEMIKFKSKLQ